MNFVSAPSAVFEVAYFLSQTDADTNTNALTNPYTNPTTFSNQTIYTRMHNIAAPNACYDTNSFTLAVTGNPTPQTPSDYEECDDSINGTDTDGFFNNFLLNTKDNEILGSLNPSVYEVSYHTTPAGANTDKNTDVIDSIIDFYTEINAHKRSVFQDLLGARKSEGLLEKIIHKRVQIDDNVLTKNFNYFVTNALHVVNSKSGNLTQYMFS